MHTEVAIAEVTADNTQLLPTLLVKLLAGTLRKREQVKKNFSSDPQAMRSWERSLRNPVASENITKCLCHSYLEQFLK